MYNFNPYAAYKNQDLDTNTNEELVGRLLGAAAICTKMAAMDIEGGKLDRASSEMIKTQSILLSLKGSLDMQYEVSKGLDPLYDYMLRRLLDANLKKDTEILKEISGLLIELRDAWNEAMKSLKKSQAYSTGTL